eukprot:COSAG05_NODE_11831_length_494_cov_0.787342_1_plen_106_part_00
MHPSVYVLTAPCIHVYAEQNRRQRHYHSPICFCTALAYEWVAARVPSEEYIADLGFFAVALANVGQKRALGEGQHRVVDLREYTFIAGTGSNVNRSEQALYKGSG